MSEYQYYEFQAVDRPLNREEMGTLRRYSTRAQITPSSFTNEYSFGSFKGDEHEWMAKYFDAFLYLANWGTRVLMLRLPARLLPERTARGYCKASAEFEDALTLRARDGNVVLRFCWTDEEGGGDWIEGGGILGSLLPIRSELAHGDLRALYLAWLRGIQDGDQEDSDSEPPVPPGLNSLSPALVDFVEFFEIDRDLIRAAAEGSADVESIQSDSGVVARWIAKLPVTEKDEVLRRVLEGGAVHLGIELRARFEREQSAGRPSVLPISRTVGQLLATAKATKQAREREEARKAAAKKARRDRDAAVAREKHLESLASRVSAAWNQVEALVSAKQSKAYAEAIQILLDLREIATRRGMNPDFTQQLATLLERHAKKKTFLEQLTAGGLL